jgi:hypothetical protein
VRTAVLGLRVSTASQVQADYDPEGSPAAPVICSKRRRETLVIAPPPNARLEAPLLQNVSGEALSSTGVAQGVKRPTSADGGNKIAHCRSFGRKTQRISLDRLLRGIAAKSGRHGRRDEPNSKPEAWGRRRFDRLSREQMT